MPGVRLDLVTLIGAANNPVEDFPLSRYAICTAYVLCLNLVRLLQLLLEPLEAGRAAGADVVVAVHKRFDPLALVVEDAGVSSSASEADTL